MTRGAFRTWYLVHKWSSVVCTAFLLMLCLTGLPLIFHDEIDRLTDPPGAVSTSTANAPFKSLDTLLAAALDTRPGEVGLYMSFDEDRPVVNITTGPTPDAPADRMTIRAYDRRSGALVGLIDEGGDGLMAFLLQLHTDMFLGLGGMLFLGVMGLLFLVAIVSGTVLYAPFMRRLAFGTVRASKSARLKWLDYHNLLGVAALAWMSVVAVTGVINTLATPINQVWQANDLAEMTAAYAGEAVPKTPGSIAAAVATARRAAPGNRVQFVAFPGAAFSSKHHFAVFLQGDRPITKRLLTPALIDARTGALTEIRPLPWYMQVLLMSQPLHFGDYGGLPLKVLWAVLDVFTILILGSGLYLWLGRNPSSSDAHVRDRKAGSAVPAE